MSITTACPECGCEDYMNEDVCGDGYRECEDCCQEWWTDINYKES